MHTYLVEMLECPACHGRLDWTMEGPIVDLASGRSYLVEKIVQSLKRPVIASDFSPSVLRRDRQRLEFWSVYDQVSLLTFDARRTPFKTGAVNTLTSNLGLPNIREPGHVLGELRRIVDGTFLAISQFYPEDNTANTSKIREAGLEMLLFRRAALESFVEAGWQVEVAHAGFGKAQPTPTSVLLEGAGIDTLPVAETTLEWCVLSATNQA